MRQTKKHLRRIIAVLLSVVLVFSTFEGISLTGYAAENTGAGDIDTETDTQEEKESDTSVSAVGTTEEEVQASEEKVVETEAGAQEEPSSAEESAQEEKGSSETTLPEEESVSEESTTETEEADEEKLLLSDGDPEGGLAYMGRTEPIDDNGEVKGTLLIIDEGEFDDAYKAEDGSEKKSFDDAAIKEILDERAKDTATKFGGVRIQYAEFKDSISKDLWNAVAEFGCKENSESFEAGFFCYGDGALDRNWNFTNPSTTENDIQIKLSKLEIQSNEGVIISFANTTFPAAGTTFSTYTDLGRTDGGQVNTLKTVFGNKDTELEAYENGEKTDAIDGCYWIIENSEEDSLSGFDVNIINQESLTAETEYTLKKSVYKGEVWSDPDGGRRGLDITCQGMDKNEILEEVRDILQKYHSGEKYDEIYIRQPSGESDVIYKDMINMLYDYLITDSKDCKLRFGFIGSNDACTEWRLWHPAAEQENDYTVSATLTIESDTVTIKANAPSFQAENVEVNFVRSKNADLDTVDKLESQFGQNDCDLVLRCENQDDAYGSFIIDSNDPDFDNYNVMVNVHNINALAAGKVYTVEKAVYAGNTWDWTDDDGTVHYGLNISYRDAGKEEALTAEEINKILSYNESGKFDEIYIEQPNGSTNTIFKTVVDEAYKHLKPQPDGKEYQIRFVFTDQEGSSVDWRLVNPVAEQEGDQNVSAEFNLKDNNATIRVGSQSLRADRVELGFHTNNKWNPTKADELRELFGTEDCGLRFISGAKISDGDFYIGIPEEDPEDYTLGINVHDVNDLTVDTEYIVKKFYEGEIYESDDEEGKSRVLGINHRGSGKTAMTPEEIKAILSCHEGDTFDGIHIEQPYSSPTISKEVADVAYKYLKDGGDRSITFGFVVDENKEFSIQWRLVNPEETQEGDQTVSATFNLKNDTVTIKTGKPSFKAERVELGFYTSNKWNSDKANELRKLFGEEDCDLIFTGKTNKTDGYFSIGNPVDDDSENYSIGISVHDINKLDADTEYTVKRFYKGVPWVDWTDDDGTVHYALNISYRDAGKESALTADEIAEILSYNSDDRYSQIFIEQPAQGSTDTISKDVANEAYKYLEEPSEKNERRIVFSFKGEKEGSIEWRLVNPAQTQQADRTASAELKVTDDAVVIKVTKKPEFEAEGIEVGFTRNAEHDSAVVENIKKIIGIDQEMIVFCDDTGIELGGWCEIDDHVWLGANIGELEVGKEYKAEKRIYKGETYTWKDNEDDAKEYVGLNINYRGAGKDTALTMEELRQIISRRGSERFDEIYFEQPMSDNNVVLKEAADMLSPYLKPKAKNEDHRLKFVFVNAAAESRVEWTLVDPEAAQEGDQTANATMGISGDKVSLTVSGPAFKAKRTEFAIQKDLTKDSDSAALMKLFGESGCALVFKADTAQDAYGYFYVYKEDNILRIELYDINAIKADTVYSIEKDRYLGDVTENYILISSSNRLYDQERFTKEQLEDIVKYYKSENRSFDNVLISQKYTTDNANIIDKDLYNTAMQLLSGVPDRRLSFCFCGCQSTDKNRLPLNWEKQEWDNRNKHMEYAEFGYYYLQDDFIWSFVNPTETDKDIDANVAMKTEKNKGITIKLADNRPYKADDVSVQYYCDPQSVTGTKLEAALGKPEDFGGDKPTDLFVLNKETNTPDNRVSVCYMTNEEWGDGYGNPPYDQNYSLYFNNVREWIPGREFWVTKMEYLSETAEKEFQLPALPEGAQNPVWQSYNTDIAVIDGDKLKQIDGNEGYVHFSVTYTLGGEEYQKAYRVYMVQSVIPITKIQFDRKSLTMEVPPKNADWEALEYLQVKYYPANATIDMDQSSLKWTTSDNKVVTLTRNSSGKCEGEIKAVGAGKATIRAEYKEGIYAECEVTVEEPIVIEDDKWPEPYAVTNFDTRLADVGFPKDDSGEWKWNEPDTSLAPYAGMDWHDFAATYTRKSDGKTMQALVGVRMATVTGVGIIPAGDEAGIPLALTNGESVLLGAEVDVENGDYIDDIFQKAAYKDKISVIWTSQPTGLLSEISNPDGTKTQKFTANTSVGKKTIMVSVVNSQTGKAIAKDSITINITSNPVMNFAAMKVTVDDRPESNTSLILDKKNANGKMHFAAGDGDSNGYTFTVKSSDASVIAVKAKKGEANTIEYTLKNYGKAQLVITANDEIKSSWNIEVSVPDKAPQLIQSQVTINKASIDQRALLTVVYADGYRADGADAVQVDGTDFAYENGYLVLKNSSLKGTASVKVTIKCISDDGGDRFTQSKTVKVKLTDKAPKITLKQTKKVNAFYQNTSEGHSGILTVSASGAKISGISFDPTADFELVSTEKKNSYRIRAKSNTASTQTLKVTCEVTDNTQTTFKVQKDLKVTVENKAPVLTLSAKTDTLYPRAGFSDSILVVSDKATGRPIELAAVTYNNQPIENTVSLGKNAYDIAVEEGGRVRFVLNNGQNNNYTKGTDKITLGITGGDWTKPVNISYSLKVDVNEPKLRLSSTKLTLNKNEAVGGAYQAVEIALALAGGPHRLTDM